MSVYDEFRLGPVAFKTGMINGDYIAITLTPDEEDRLGSYVQDGQLYISVRAWEGMQENIREYQTLKQIKAATERQR